MKLHFFCLNSTIFHNLNTNQSKITYNLTITKSTGDDINLVITRHKMYRQFTYPSGLFIKWPTLSLSLMLDKSLGWRSEVVNTSQWLQIHITLYKYCVWVIVLNYSPFVSYSHSKFISKLIL